MEGIVSSFNQQEPFLSLDIINWDDLVSRDSGVDNAIKTDGLLV